MSQQNVDLIRGLYDAFAKGDVPAVLGGMDPGIEWNEAESFPYADRNPYIGPQAVLEGVFMRIMTDWEAFCVVTESVLDAGEVVVALGRYKGKHRTTGKDLDAQHAHIWWLRDGKVTRFQQYVDTAQALAVGSTQ